MDKTGPFSSYGWGLSGQRWHPVRDLDESLMDTACGDGPRGLSQDVRDNVRASHEPPPTEAMCQKAWRRILTWERQPDVRPDK